MLSCRKATELLEKQEHCRLSIKESMQLKIHLFVCKYCNRYVRQVQLIDSVTERLVLTHDTSDLEAKVIEKIFR